MAFRRLVPDLLLPFRDPPAPFPPVVQSLFSLLLPVFRIFFLVVNVHPRWNYCYNFVVNCASFSVRCRFDLTFRISVLFHASRFSFTCFSPRLSGVAFRRYLWSRIFYSLFEIHRIIYVGYSIPLSFVLAFALSVESCLHMSSPFLTNASPDTSYISGLYILASFVVTLFPLCVKKLSSPTRCPDDIRFPFLAGPFLVGV